MDNVDIIAVIILECLLNWNKSRKDDGNGAICVCNRNDLLSMCFVLA